jgi:ribosomal protein L28
MGKICAITGKKSRASASRSHSNIQTKRRQKANLHKHRIGGKVVILSTRALKTLKKKAAALVQ